MFFYWIQKLQKCVNFVDLVKSFPNSNEYLLAKLGVDTAENDPLKIWRGGGLNIPKSKIYGQIHGNLVASFFVFQLILDCIDADFCDQGLIFQRFSSFTFFPLHQSRIL